MTFPRLHMAALVLDSRVERGGLGRAPTAFRIWAAGENLADDGSVFFTPQSAARLLAEQASRGRAYAIDFDHLSIHENRPATAGRAAGYFEIETRPGEGGPELWAVNVEWCDDVRAGLEQSPPLWRYFSPAFFTGEDSKEVTSLINLALCINPLTHGIPSLASRKPRAASARMEAGIMEEQLALLDALIAATEDEAQKAALSAARAALAATADTPADTPTEEAAPPPATKEGDGDDDEKKRKKEESETAAPSAPSGGGGVSSVTIKTTHAAGAAGAGGDAITSLARKVVELERKVELSEIDALLAKHATLPEEFRAHCRTLSLASARVSINAVIKQHAATRAISPTHGASDGGEGLDPKTADALDRAMGINRAGPKMPEKLTDGRFVMHNVRPSDLVRMNAQKAKA